MNTSASPTNLVNQVVDLISLPEIYLEVRKLLDDPDAALSDIADVINVDPNLTGRILRLANSAYCGFAAKIETVNRAMTMLGTQQIHDIVLSTSIARSFSNVSEEVEDMESFWRSCVVSGSSAKLIADSRDILDSERMFTAGLLAHVGRLVLLMFQPDTIKEAYAKASSEMVSVSRALQDELGYHDGDIAGELLTRWRLPDTLVSLIRHHVHPEEGETANISEESGIVHVASAIADMKKFQLDFDGLILRLNENVWQSLGLERDTLSNLIEDSESLAGEITEQFLPDAA